METTDENRRRILALLAEEYRGERTALNYSTDFELLIAVMLSAQCTDKRVNVITTRLFPEWNSPGRMLTLEQEELESLIRDCGLFRSKARNILAACRILADDYAGRVPRTLEDLIRLPGVGRKTANVILSQLFDVPAIAVDTHVFRVANRSGLAAGNTPEKVEAGLMRAIPREDWADAHHWLIWHGRRVCHARRPACHSCLLAGLCAWKRDLRESGSGGAKENNPE